MRLLPLLLIGGAEVERATAPLWDALDQPRPPSLARARYLSPASTRTVR